MEPTIQVVNKPPYKSAALGLLFCVVLGPVGLLYSSLWGGLIMIPVGIIVISSHFVVPIILCWLICCIWAVKAVDDYNKQLVK